MRARSSVTRTALLLLALVLALGTLALGTTAPASAAPVYEIDGAWVNPPATIGRGNPVVAEWRINVNDDQPAPSNDPVPNVTATFALQKAVFDEIPDMCLTEDVDPASEISPDGTRLTCNFGAVEQGTALVLQTPVVANGITGERIQMMGTSPSGEPFPLPEIPIRNDFGMDFHVGGNYGGYRWNDIENPTSVDLDFQWSLRLEKGSDPGPDEVTYRLDLRSTTGATVDVGTHYDSTEMGCTPFDYGTADGHPWSPETTMPSRPQQNTSFVDECVLREIGPNVFELTLRGINYDLATAPSHDSSAANGTGNPLPPNWDYIASGSVYFKVNTTQPGSLAMDVTEPTYRSPTQLTAQGLTTNNTTNKFYTLPGYWSASWWRPYTQSGGSPWDDTYRVSAGTRLLPHVNHYSNRIPGAPTSLYGECLTFDADYVDYVPKPTDYFPYAQVRGLIYNPDPTEDPTNGERLDNPPELQYYVGDVGGNPNEFDCGSDPGNWTTTEPADLTTVEALRIVYPRALLDAEGIDGFQLNAHVRVEPDVEVGQDVWMFGSVLDGGGTWLGKDEPYDSAVATPTPGARYIGTNGRRDILRIVTALPYIRKAASQATITPTVPVEFTLTYSATGSGIIPPTVDDYQIVDTLPDGMSYVPGSADPEPVVDGQRLTWSLDDVTTNVQHPLTYRAVAAANVPPGTQLTNVAQSSYGGQQSGRVSETVTTTTNGYTLITKTADTPFIPNVDGAGDGAGSWTVTLRSLDPLPQAYTDVIDILPYEGDQRGTSYSGSYALDRVVAPGQTVYYSSAPPATLTDDPSSPANGGANTPSALWTTIEPPNPTAVRVIGPELAPNSTRAFQVFITTDGAAALDRYVNRAQGRAQHTRLVMRTSAPMRMAPHYAANLKKYVQDARGVWRDANDVTDYPAFQLGDTVKYRIVVTNVGQGTLTDIDVTDDEFPQGAFHIDSLAPGQQKAHEYATVIPGDAVGALVNTACAEADTPDDAGGLEPVINCDPAGREIVNYVTTKVSDPPAGTAVQTGETITYTVSVTQRGTVPAEAVFTDDLADVLDDATYNGDAAASIGTVAYVGGKLVWSGTVPVGQVAHVTYSVTVKGGKRLGNRDLVNPVTSPGCVVRDGKVVDCDTAHPVPEYDLAVRKDVIGSNTVLVGDRVRYRLRVSNKGPDQALAPITLTDALPKGLQLRSAKGRGWDCRVRRSTDVVSCTYASDLAAGRTAPPVIVTAKTTRRTTGRVVNVAKVSAAGDTVRSNNRNPAAVRVESLPALPSTGFRARIGGAY